MGPVRNGQARVARILAGQRDDRAEPPAAGRFVGQVNGAAAQRAMANAPTQVRTNMANMLPWSLHKQYQDFLSAVLADSDRVPIRVGDGE